MLFPHGVGGTYSKQIKGTLQVIPAPSRLVTLCFDTHCTRVTSYCLHCKWCDSLLPKPVDAILPACTLLLYSLSRFDSTSSLVRDHCYERLAAPTVQRSNVPLPPHDPPPPPQRSTLDFFTRQPSYMFATAPLLYEWAMTGNYFFCWESLLGNVV